jgi:hypothetical protein
MDNNQLLISDSIITEKREYNERFTNAEIVIIILLNIKLFSLIFISL